jgi:hypothetical protein
MPCDSILTALNSIASQPIGSSTWMSFIKNFQPAMWAKVNKKAFQFRKAFGVELYSFLEV